MPFQPQPFQKLIINNQTYQVMEHPAAPGMPYGQEGRQAIVYQLGLVGGQGGNPAGLKVFKPRYQLSNLPNLTGQLAHFAALDGLQVCWRTVLTSQNHPTLLQDHPTLKHAVTMPWITGPNWMEIILDRRELTLEQSLSISYALAKVLAKMERENLAHCDLSGSNVIIPALEIGAVQVKSPVELVDIEQLYAPTLQKPPVLPAGSPGYAHREVSEGVWGAPADRFAGAVLLAEILGWCDKNVRNESWEESYFDPDELQKLTDRYRTLVRKLHEQWGAEVAVLFEQAWYSQSLSQCAPFQKWAEVLAARQTLVTQFAPGQGRTNGHTPTRLPSALAPAFDKSQEIAVQSLVETGEKLFAKGDISEALVVYRKAYAMASAESPLLGSIYQRLKELRTSQELTRLSYNLTPLTGETSPHNTQLSESRWQPGTKQKSRMKLLYNLAGLSLVIGAVLFLVATLFSNPLLNLATSLTQQWLYQGMSALLLALLIGGLELWIFRQRIRPAHRAWFILFTGLGGLAGGILGGLIYDNLDTTTSFVGALIGAVGGGISSLFQNSFIGSKSQSVKWFLANLVGWSLIWLGGFILAWSLPQPASMAFAAAFILSLTGLGLALLLAVSPDIEF